MSSSFQPSEGHPTTEDWTSSKSVLQRYSCELRLKPHPNNSDGPPTPAYLKGFGPTFSKSCTASEQLLCNTGFRIAARKGPGVSRALTPASIVLTQDSSQRATLGAAKDLVGLKTPDVNHFTAAFSTAFLSPRDCVPAKIKARETHLDSCSTRPDNPSLNVEVPNEFIDFQSTGLL